MGSASTLLRQCAVMVGLVAVLAWAAPEAAKGWVVGTGAVLLAVFVAVSLHRHRQIRRLAEEIDEVLHSGRTVDFSNTVICMTSNAGSSDQSTGGLGFNKSEEQLSEEKTRKALAQFLRPEFLGRVDEVIAFKPLTEETVETFAHAILDDINPRDSWRASKAFRQHIAVEIAKRCLVKSIELAGGELA